MPIQEAIWYVSRVVGDVEAGLCPVVQGTPDLKKLEGALDAITALSEMCG